MEKSRETVDPQRVTSRDDLGAVFRFRLSFELQYSCPRLRFNTVSIQKKDPPAPYSFSVLSIHSAAWENTPCTWSSIRSPSLLTVSGSVTCGRRRTSPICSQ